MSAARDYLPNAIRELNACFCGGENTIGQRLCTDHRMQQVWKTLTTEGTREAEDREKFERRLKTLCPSVIDRKHGTRTSQCTGYL